MCPDKHVVMKLSKCSRAAFVIMVSSISIVRDVVNSCKQNAWSKVKLYRYAFTYKAMKQHWRIVNSISIRINSLRICFCVIINNFESKPYGSKATVGQSFWKYLRSLTKQLRFEHMVTYPSLLIVYSDEFLYEDGPISNEYIEEDDSTEVQDLRILLHL